MLLLIRGAHYSIHMRLVSLWLYNRILSIIRLNLQHILRLTLDLIPPTTLLRMPSESLLRSHLIRHEK